MFLACPSFTPWLRSATACGARPAVRMASLQLVGIAHYSSLVAPRPALSVSHPAGRSTAVSRVNDWIDRNGPIANADLRRIAEIDTLKASKLLKAWVEQGLLEPLPGRAKRMTAYIKPAQPAEQPSLLSEAEDNKL